MLRKFLGPYWTLRFLVTCANMSSVIWAWWLTLVSQYLGSRGREDQGFKGSLSSMSEFEVSLGYRGPHLKKQNKKQKYIAQIPGTLLTGFSFMLTAEPFFRSPEYSRFLSEVEGKHSSVLAAPPNPFLVVIWIWNQKVSNTRLHVIWYSPWIFMGYWRNGAILSNSYSILYLILGLVPCVTREQ